ncbi:putative thiamine pyrophosphokinase [Selenomonas ruminantium subsp. lactilytica TAM6421]|uniref:Thiamine diphosphokinase n=1 Tax=Selenomonas ruminantium subsp. lactilytica (strain NBRC 103574 / TAM6421) TaxID=927704 RepID=I0GPI1_SELRL|nr:thiamine diphosphokinase [Selenomonas ruminantium]BAL82668.1 putative thiamine pyrophosphokinase [Selenomonas ruminantium subsp. lactilytica TAM6421]
MTLSANDKLTLPQLTLQGTAYQGHPWLLLTGGRPPADSWFSSLPPMAKIYAADHGLDTCKKNQLRPDYILGDGDSAAPATWQWGKSLGVPMEEFPAAKDYTDTQLALQKMAKAPIILITGAFGGRLDHLYSLMYSCAHQPTPCVLVDEQEFLCFVKDNESITLSFTQRPLAISLLPVTATCHGVCLDNVRWPLNNANLDQSMPNAISNELSADQSTLTCKVRQGILGIYCHWPAPLPYHRKS